MLYYEIIVILLFILFLLLSIKYGDDVPLWIILALIFWVGIFFGITDSDQDLQGNKKNINIPIVSLERGQEINGDFVLGFGTVETKTVYYAYEEVGKNKYKLVTLPNVVITEIDYFKPAYIKVTECKRPFLFVYCKELGNSIYVPKGTIKKRFNW